VKANGGKGEEGLSLRSRVRTFIPGLDQALDGGLLRGTTTLVVGGPGTGKTILCLQYILRGVERGEHGVYVSLEELPHHLIQEAEALGMEFRDYLEEGRVALVDCVSERLGMAPPYPFAVRRDQFGFDGILGLIGEAVREVGAVRLAIDPVGVLLKASGEGEREEAVLKLGAFLWSQGVTSLLTARSEEEELGYITHGLIRLEQREEREGGGGWVRRRTLHIVKMRGTATTDQVLPFRIASGGIITSG